MTNRRTDNAAGPAMIVTEMTPGVLMQVMAQTPSGAASVMSEMTMSVGVLSTSAHVGVTPTATVQRPGKTRSEGGRVPALLPPRNRQFAEWAGVLLLNGNTSTYVCYPTIQAEPYLTNSTTHFTTLTDSSLARPKTTFRTSNFDMFPSGADTILIARKHIKKILWPEDKEPAYDCEQDAESEGEDVTPAEAKKTAADKGGEEGPH